MDKNINVNAWVTNMADYLHSTDSAVSATLTTIIDGRTVNITVTVPQENK